MRTSKLTLRGTGQEMSSGAVAFNLSRIYTAMDVVSRFVKRKDCGGF